jgi:hypothetical protein
MTNGQESEMTTDEPQDGVVTETPTTPPEGETGLVSDEHGVQSGFSHATLQGKSIPEAESYVSLLEGTVREQNAALNARAAEPAPAPRAEPTDFYDNPRQAIREEIGEMIAPFVSDLRESRTDRARETVRNEFGAEWNEMEPIVDNLIAQGRNAGMTINEHDPAMLRTLFYTAKGYQNHVSGGLPQPTKSAPPRIPQHRPSAAPLPESGAKPALRELTENERRLAREWDMTHEEYIELQEAEADEFLREDE